MNQTALLPLLVSALFSTVTLADDPMAARANAEGNREYFAARYPSALAKFEQALLKATESEDQQYRAIAMYGLARTNGQMCRLVEAENWFRDSIALREKLPDDRYARVTQSYLEFARFLMTYGRDKEAVPYMEKTIPNLEKLNIETSDPIAFAEFLAHQLLSRPQRTASGGSVVTRDT
jgi:tetratricopeptide (TPR) repeat protein